MTGDSVAIRGTACFCMLEPISARLASSCSRKGIMAVATAMIPFLEHDDANRALIGSNMQKQAVPLMATESPVIGTGVEHYAARYSGEMIVADATGTVVDVAH